MSKATNVGAGPNDAAAVPSNRAAAAVADDTAAAAVPNPSRAGHSDAPAGVRGAARNHPSD